MNACNLVLHMWFAQVVAVRVACDTATNRPLRDRDRLAHWAEGVNYRTSVYATYALATPTTTTCRPTDVMISIIQHGKRKAF